MGPWPCYFFLSKNRKWTSRELDITSITEQYLEYLEGMQNLNFGIAGDYLYLASTLLFLKSKTALSPNGPRVDEDADETEDSLGIFDHTELIRRLEELAHFQQMGQILWELPRLGENNFVRPKVNRKEVINAMSLPMNLNVLVMAMVNLIEKEGKQYTPLEKDPWTIKERLSSLKRFLREGMRIDFEGLLGTEEERKERGNIIVTLISLLELVRLKKVELFQEGYCTPVEVKVIDSLENFDIDDIGPLAEYRETDKAFEMPLQ